jgi:hypothetical protein
MRWPVKKPGDGWKRWFAWYRVQMGEQIVFLELIERRITIKGCGPDLREYRDLSR